MSIDRRLDKIEGLLAKPAVEHTPATTDTDIARWLVLRLHRAQIGDETPEGIAQARWMASLLGLNVNPPWILEIEDPGNRPWGRSYYLNAPTPADYYDGYDG